MLPKVSFTDNKKEENGSKMLSRFGKMTTFNYPIFRGIDPIQQHSKFLTNIERKNPLNIDSEKEAILEEKRQIMQKDNSVKSKTDLQGFIKRMNQQKAQVFTQKTMPTAKVNVTAAAQSSQQPQQQQHSTVQKGAAATIEAEEASHAMASLEIEEVVDIDAQVEQVKLLLHSIQERNNAEEAGRTATSNDEIKKDKTGTNADISRAMSQERLIDRKKGKSMAFKALSRSEVDKIRGNRPRYEQHFLNEANRYHVKFTHQYPKIKGQAKFDPPKVQARDASPKKLCNRGLTKLAELALNVRSSKKTFETFNGQRASIGSSAMQLSARRAKVNASDQISQDYDPAIRRSSEGEDSLMNVQGNSGAVMKIVENKSLISSQQNLATQPVEKGEFTLNSSRKNKASKNPSLFEAHPAQKERFIEQASSKELVNFIRDPIAATYSASNYGDENSYMVKKPGDIGTAQSRLVRMSRQQARFIKKKDGQDGNDKRFLASQSNIESLSNHRSQKVVDFDKHTKRAANVFAENKFIKQGVGRVLRPPSGSGKLQDSTKSKDSLLRRTDLIVPKFDSQISRPSQLISHNYNFDQVELDSSHAKINNGRRSPQPIPLAKSRGREDNLMYRVSEGYNLESNDKTFFDKYNVMEMLSQSRQGATSAGLSHYTSKSTTNDRVQKILRAQRAAGSTARISSENSDEEEAIFNGKGTTNKRDYMSVIERKAPSLAAYLSSEQKPMTLEERILQGAFKS